ncbi:hypothetical protein [Corynebacterium sp. sy039]|uniref:hypothetical protein n=1 Tax=Corynebacterium sp. sy039 TaxID=2599641 RepID=UPI0011B810B0|nr:hypothetical protein [Corynebacterium sp. sy039]QDZ41970.1 hypothetical protein FQV43_01395 [Corynebacterium sp. sy039]
MTEGHEAPHESKNANSPEQIWENFSKYDAILLGVMAFTLIYSLALLPAKVWLINHPWIYAMTHGGYISATILGAEAGKNHTSLLFPIVLSSVFGIKFLPVWFFAGKRWGMNFIKQSASGSMIAKKFLAVLSSEEKRTRSIVIMLGLCLIAFVPVLPIPITLLLMLLGVFHVPFLLVLTAIFVGKLITNSAMAFFGYQHGEAVLEVIDQINKYSNWVFFALLAFAFIQIFFQQRKAQHIKPQSKKNS